MDDRKTQPQNNSFFGADSAVPVVQTLPADSPRFKNESKLT